MLAAVRERADRESALAAFKRFLLSQRGLLGEADPDAYEQLDAECREVARRILLRLAGGEGDTVVRRRVPLSELEGDGVTQTLAVLTEQRLVTIGEGDVEVFGADLGGLGIVRFGKVGSARCRLMPQRAAVDFAVGWFVANRKPKSP